MENPIELPETSPERFGISHADFIKDIFDRRYTDYYSWIVPEIDQKGGLLTLGRMAIIGGPHGSGKSTYITELAKHNAISKPTMLIPLEMGQDFTIMMLACNMFNDARPATMDFLTYGEIEEGYLYQRPQPDQDLFIHCVDDLYKNYPNLYIATPNSLSYDDLEKMIMAYYTEHNIKFFVIDHLHQLDSSSGESETAFYSMVAKRLKELCGKLGIALLAVVQLTKSANGMAGSMDLGSFKGTSEFTSNAHRVVVIKKPTYVSPSKAEAKSQAGAGNILVPTTDVMEYMLEHQANFEEESRYVREFIFLKTRGRDGGVITVKMDQGKFVFETFGHYKFKYDPSSGTE